MVEPRDPYREPKDVGAKSPASGEAKEQDISGAKGGPRQPRVGRTSRQPAQTSGRRLRRHQQERTERKSFRADENPAEQGKGRPDPERLKQRSGLQGIGARSGSHAAHGERTEERGQQGGPKSGHARYGRQKVPGQPERPIPPGADPDDYT